MERPRRRSRYHHFLSEHHLRHFADARNRVWVFDKREGGTSRHVPVPVIGAENRLYTPGEGPDPDDDYVEQALARHVDGPAAGPMRKILRHEDLSPAEKQSIAAYIAFLDMRTPTAKRILIERFQLAMDEWSANFFGDREALRDHLKKEGLNSSDAALDALGRVRIKITPGMWLDFIQQYPGMPIERIMAIEWFRVPLPDRLEFMTSDVGIIKFAGGFDEPVAHRIGFADGRTSWLIPFSPGVALALSSCGDWKGAEGKPAWIQAVNRRLVLDSDRFSYARHPVPEVPDWVSSALGDS